MQALIASDTRYHNSVNTTHTTNTPNQRSTVIEPTTPLRKRRPSKPQAKPADGQLQNDHAHLLLGESLGVGEVVEALRGKVEVERVVAMLMEWRRVWQSVGKGKGEGVQGGDGEERGSGKGDEAAGVAVSRHDGEIKGGQVWKMEQADWNGSSQERKDR